MPDRSARVARGGWLRARRDRRPRYGAEPY